MPGNPLQATDTSEFEALSPETIELEPDSMDQAVQLSGQLVNEARQWQTYLNALALFGFEQWLRERAVQKPMHLQSCSVRQPQYANVLETVCNLRVGEFKLCLITLGSSTDEVVQLSRAVVDLPEFTAHFYVVLEVLEEQEQVNVWGFLRHDQLIEHLQSANLAAAPDWTYHLPLSWFEPNPDLLLLYLSCLDPAAISLPLIPDRLATLAHQQDQLGALSSRLRSPDVPLWQVLSWEQGVAVLTSPALLDWLYRLQNQEMSSPPLHLTEVLQRLTQPAINVGCWLRDELDELAQTLSWVLLPPLSVASSLRSPAEEIDTLLTQLGRTGMMIPTHARSGYKDLSLAGTALRIYVVTWPLLSEDVPEWTLLLVLGAQPGHSLPDGTQLRVSDQTTVLLERRLEPGSEDSYLYARVVGTWDETFLVTIGLNQEAGFTLPPFAFYPNEPQ